MEALRRRALRPARAVTSAHKLLHRASPLRRFHTPIGGSPAAPGGQGGILKVSEEVTDALATGKPVVALETTIYTHGALGDDLDLEGIVRRNGAVPAVVGVLAGKPTVGLQPDEVTQMIQGSPKKLSRRDLAYLTGMGIMGNKMHGGTTIAGTMVLARLAGIRVFGTGGLGGVHRGGHESLDISADLTELGRTRMAVVSSGCKGFLDIPRTLEYLETQGVLVSTFAGTGSGDVNFPAFWARDSGTRSPSAVYTEEQAAAMILAQERLGIESGMLFANPIPEKFAIPSSEMSAIIEQAVRESVEQGIQGSANTPFILTRIRELTNGASVPANKALVQSNVERAAKIAVALARLEDEGPEVLDRAINRGFGVELPKRPKPSPPSPDVVERSQADILVAGSVAMDLSCDYAGENASRPCHAKVKLCSIVGDDLAGASIISSLQASGMDITGIRQLSREQHPSSRTAQYVAVNNASKNLVLAMADMGIFTAHSFSSHWATAVQTSQPKWVVVDANWADRDIRSWVQAAKQSQAKVAFEPVSIEKSARLFSKRQGLSDIGVFPQASIDLATPNQYELAAMYSAAQANEYLEKPQWWKTIDALGMKGARDRFVRMTSASMTDAGIPQQAIQLLPFIPTIVTKLGSNGALLTTILGKDDPRLFDVASEPFILSRTLNDDENVGGVYMRLFPAAGEVDTVVSVNGVGDTFLGVLISGLAQGGKVEDLIDIAQQAAVLTLQSRESVGESLEMLRSELSAISSRSKRLS